RAALVNDRLVDELLEELPVIDAQRTRGLGHEDADQLLLRINPEVGARKATPHVLAGRSGGPCEARFPPDGEAEAKGVARRPEEQFAGREHRVELVLRDEEAGVAHLER